MTVLERAQRIYRAWRNAVDWQPGTWWVIDQHGACYAQYLEKADAEKDVECRNKTSVVTK